MRLDTVPLQFQEPTQSEALVKRILSVAEILARVLEEEEDENDSETLTTPEVRYRDWENRTSDC